MGLSFTPIHFILCRFTVTVSNYDSLKVANMAEPVYRSSPGRLVDSAPCGQMQYCSYGTAKLLEKDPKKNVFWEWCVRELLHVCRRSPTSGTNT